jgi:hypothetical protein
MKRLSLSTMNAILSEWKAPRYDGSSDVETWLAEIDKGCEKYGIPIKQRVPVALYYMEGEAKIVMEFIRDHEMRTAKKAWRWHKFKKDLVLIHSKSVLFVGLVGPYIVCRRA